MADEPISAKEFGASFKGFLQQMASQAPADEPFFRKRIREHFGAEPSALAIISEKFEPSEHANVHVAVEAFVGGDGRSFELLGISGDHLDYTGLSLAQLSATGSSGLMGGSAPSLGPVRYVNLGLQDDKVLACTQLGLYLVRDQDRAIAILVQGPREMFRTGVVVEVLATTREEADRCLAEMRTAMRRRNVYRGQVVSLDIDANHNVQVRFHRLPTIQREQIILPAGLLERIERQSIGFARHAQRLLSTGRHLKRGVLLHGPPGTGKTFSAMYLAGRMPDRTVLLVTGRGMGLLEQACSMARLLQPATVILEDADLIAEERTRRDPGCVPLLFELLNQMDGLADDADILFLLTTNRADLLEPALASRPGRIDQAIEVPLPDPECRLRLLQLYARGLKVDAPFEPLVARTEGASAAFIRELLRRAALFSADETSDLVVLPGHFEAALKELVVDGGDLTRSLLGIKAR